MIYLLSPLEVEGTYPLPMIKFETVAKEIDFRGCDTLMFTSKQAVESAETINPLWKTLPCLAIGSATAKKIKALGAEVLYQASSFYGESLSQEIIAHFGERKILYLRPKKVSFESKVFLEKAGVAIEEQIIYQTSCREYNPKDKPIQGAIIIFTSPSTIACFLRNFEWESSYTAIVIGEATQAHLPPDARFEVAEIPLIESCLQKAKTLLLHRANLR